MGEVERQIEAWADAAAPDVASGAVDVREAMSGRSGRLPSRPVRRGRWALSAAAVVVALVVGVAGVRALVDDDTQQLFAGEPPAGTEPGFDDPVSNGPPGDGRGKVTFEVLHVGVAGEVPVGMRSASTDDEVAALWADLIPLDGQAGQAAIGPYPNEDERADRVVVSFVIAHDACPPELSGFRRQSMERGRPDRLIPQFVETATECAQPLIPKRYVVALDWASAGDRFSVFVDGGNLSDPGAMPGSATSMEIFLDRARPDPVLIDVELDGTTVASGGELAGTVVVSNNSGEPIDIGYCGAVFAVGLENDEVDQQLAFLRCRQQGEIAPGVSRFEVTVLTTFGSCVGDGPDPVPPGMVACLPEGAVPLLPPGEYETRLYPPDGIDADAPPLMVTLS